MPNPTIKFDAADNVYQTARHGSCKCGGVQVRSHGTGLVALVPLTLKNGVETGAEIILPVSKLNEIIAAMRQVAGLDQPVSVQPQPMIRKDMMESVERLGLKLGQPARVVAPDHDFNGREGVIEQIHDDGGLFLWDGTSIFGWFEPEELVRLPEGSLTHIKPR